jgi:DNA gyrase subunit B
MLSNKSIAKYDIPPFRVSTNDKEDEGIFVQEKQQLLDLLMAEGKKGLNVQRYKGLGEMNPEQLWNTTMNPEIGKRILLQVKVEDIVDTDEIFTILMGEEVEPRREFIQNNALEVSVLDI